MDCRPPYGGRHSGAFHRNAPLYSFKSFILLNHFIRNYILLRNSTLAILMLYPMFIFLFLLFCYDLIMAQIQLFINKILLCDRKDDF